MKNEKGLNDKENEEYSIFNYKSTIHRFVNIRTFHNRQ
jgi:hypothetical protein